MQHNGPDLGAAGTEPFCKHGALHYHSDADPTDDCFHPDAPSLSGLKADLDDDRPGVLSLLADLARTAGWWITSPVGVRTMLRANIALGGLGSLCMALVNLIDTVPQSAINLNVGVTVACLAAEAAWSGNWIVVPRPAETDTPALAGEETHTS